MCWFKVEVEIDPQHANEKRALKHARLIEEKIEWIGYYPLLFYAYPNR